MVALSYGWRATHVLRYRGNITAKDSAEQHAAARREAAAEVEGLIIDAMIGGIIAS
jgi:hypothetical protein